MALLIDNVGNRHRWHAMLLAAGVFLAVAPALAETPLIGRVVSVDKSSVLIQPEGVGAQPVRLPVEPGKIPGDLSAGARVRLWSDSDVAAGGPGWRLAPQAGGRVGTLDADRTGVRSRIGRGAGQGPFGGGQGAGSGGGGRHGR
jgi:hypothetical protein